MGQGVYSQRLKYGPLRPALSGRADRRARKKQLKEEKAKPKRKVLVVDDSVTICRGIPKLLEPDYEVAQANSGVTRPVIGKYFPQLHHRRTGISRRTYSRREKSIGSRIVLG